ncbi:MAG TPA: ABC transporter substrate-binding protein [Burkholderiales bacterium]|nr:ABC transporter substrate-binding protein [Burkholderiales bacterium]
MRALLAISILLGCSLAAAQNINKKPVKLVAGSPGYDHIQPFIAERMKLWERYKVDVEFMGGNYFRSNQMMSTADFDAGYNQYANAIRAHSAGVDNVIVGASSANCALIVASPKVKDWADLKGKRFGIVTKFDVQYLTLVKHILPRHGLKASDLDFALVPVPEVAAGLLTGDVAGAFPFEPFGTNAVAKGAKVLLKANDMIDQSKIKSDMLRNGFIMTRKFIKANPEVAKRLVWAHMDAIEMMRRDKKAGLETLKHYNPKIDPKLLEDSYDNCGWNYQKPPQVWVETLIGWMKEDKLIQKDVSYKDVVDFSLQDSYPGYPAYEKLK